MQDTAKSRLAAAAARSERRLQKQRRDAKRARDGSGMGGKSFSKRKRPRLSSYGNRGNRTVDDGSDDDESAIVSWEQRKFFEQVKGALRNNSMYKEFLSLLNLHRNGIISTTELLFLTADMFDPASSLPNELKKVPMTFVFFILKTSHLH